MPFTSDDLASIDTVIASGELTVRYADRSISYQNVKDLLEARQMILDDINAQTPTTRRSRITRVSQSGRGY